MILEELPDPWLDPESVANINAMFYGSEPHEYFSNRLGLLVLAAGATVSLIEEAIRRMYRVDEVRRTFGGRECPGFRADDEGDRGSTASRVQRDSPKRHGLRHFPRRDTACRFYLLHERAARVS